MTTDVLDAASGPGGDAPVGEPVATEPTSGGSLRERLVPPMPTDRFWGWSGPLLVTLLAGVLRFWDLGRPKAVMFDETYYAKDAWSLLQSGYERNWVEGANDKILAGSTASSGSDAVLESTAEYVVHPPVGKWVIATGEQLFGLTPFGWRFAVALLGTLLVLVVARIGRRMFRSTLLGCIAGLVVAVDGLALVMSRTALLDGILAFFVVAAFACLVLDRDWGRARLADAVEADLTSRGEGLGIGSRIEGGGPRLWWRPWRVAAGVLLGLACGVKWNGLYFLAAFGVMTVFWDFGARKALGVRHYRSWSVVRDLWPTLLALGLLPVLVYVASWSGWILHWGEAAGYYRNWAADRGPVTLPWTGIPVPFVPDWLRSLWHYHAEAFRFHRELDSPHPYQSSPWGWLLQARPVAVYYESSDSGSCGGKCSTAITALGNPLVWWAGVLALAYSLWSWIGRRDWRGGAIIAGAGAGILPWFAFQERTIFSFYAVVAVPFIALALAQAAGGLIGPSGPAERAAAVSPTRRTVGTVVVAAYLAATVLVTAYFWPVLTGQTIPYSDWLARMWFQSWI